MVGLERLELSTSRLSGVRSSHLSYRPAHPTGSLLKEHMWLLASEKRVGNFFHKGGDPAAGSPTATLLRLHPNHRPYRRRLLLLLVSSPASGKTDFRGVTGGVYKARERIHPGMLIQNY